LIERRGRKKGEKRGKKGTDRELDSHPGIRFPFFKAKFSNTTTKKGGKRRERSGKIREWLIFSSFRSDFRKERG